jgi:hypothetical protein
MAGSGELGAPDRPSNPNAAFLTVDLLSGEFLVLSTRLLGERLVRDAGNGQLRRGGAG